MTYNFGPGVSRVLDPSQENLIQVLWQQGRPPMDAELNLNQQIGEDWRRTLVLRGTPSGWMGNDLDMDRSFLTDPSYSNWLRFGNQRSGEKRSIPWAVVNGWMIPVTGTQTGSPPGSPNDTDTWNRLTLPPPPSNSGDTRIDFVFLEAWLARVAPNPSTTNKPSSSAIYRYGNVEGGYTYLTDDIQDPALGFETTQRVQLQYRIRVVQGLIGLATYPDGFDPTVVKGQGAATSVTSYTFSNMRTELGDPGLWRAGDGSSNALGTVDGYTYAIPIAAIMRRNSVAWDGDPSQNLNGAFNRNPTAVDRTGYKTFNAVTLNANITAAALSLTLSTATNIALPLTPSTDVTIQVGDEIMTYSVITGTTMTITQRGAFGSKAEVHKAGESIVVLSGRPDGLFSDQVAKTDILDLRHSVNSNGFDYDTLLKGNLDKLLRGQLRSNWKRSGGGPQGPFVVYQDKISSSPAALGVTLLDAPDGFREIFSDAAAIQPVEVITKPAGGGIGSGSSTETWGWPVSSTHTSGVNLNQFQNTDTITIPIAQFKTGLPGSDTDQARFLTEGLANAVRIRVDGGTGYLTPGPGNDFTVTTPTTPTSDLVITLEAGFVATTKDLYIETNLQYGPGRGLSRRPDSLHSIAYLSSSSEILTQQFGVPTDNTPMRVAWAPLWAKYRSGTYNNLLPVTAEAYADPGSKSIILTPFQRVALPDAGIEALDGTGLNAGSPGIMPENDPTGAAKWVATDPLDLFANNFPTTSAANIYCLIPRNLVPGWGEVRVPIVHTDSGNFDEGINFLFSAEKGTIAAGDPIRNFVPFSNGALSYALFSTYDVTGTAPATYNTALVLTGFNAAGMRFFTDSRGLGRAGLELPPFYGVSRLFAVYEVQDFAANGSAYNATTRVATGSGATNLLRQNFSGPTFWIEIDSDGDSTFVINAEAIDITKSPNVIASFAAGNYVIEASIFGFDRGSFDLSEQFRLVLPQERPDALAGPGTLTTTGVYWTIPGPARTADEIVINYSRTPYQGDAWGSQGSQTDIPHKRGPLTTAITYQLTSTELDELNLTRPNQKVLEVLSAIGFATTLGSGRVSGDAVSVSSFDFRNAGYEDFTSFPPSTAVDPRPDIDMGALLSGEQTDIGTQYHNCVERLPLGSLFREKDFRGNYIFGANSDAGIVSSQLAYLEDRSPAVKANGVAVSSDFEQDELLLSNASQASGEPGELIVHVDGEQGNYSLLVNYRSNRGGSVFTASDPYPGGEISSVFANTAASTSYAGILSGVAMLVRNFPTSIGAQEVSAGSELMMLIVTTAVRADIANPTQLKVLCGTNGSGEGYSAADLYRLQGRPLVNDNVRINVSPSAIQLSKKIS